MSTPEWLKSSVETHVRERYLTRAIHLAVSLTNRCPLKCSNCIVSAVYGTTVDVEKSLRLADRVIDELRSPDSQIRSLTFTGGEAPLAKAAFSRLGHAALDSGVRCGLITSGYWANTPDHARRFLENHDFLTHVTVSIDRFHLEDLPLQVSLNAIEAVLGLGLEGKIRITSADGPSPHDEAISGVVQTYPDLIERQTLVGGGRAGELGVTELQDGQILSQCFTSGPHIDDTGKILPCCSNIIYVQEDHSLSLGNIFDLPIGSLTELYRQNELLNTIKVLGWDHVRHKMSLDRASDIELGCAGGCRQCEAIMTDSGARTRLAAWVADGGARDAARRSEEWIAGAR